MHLFIFALITLSGGVHVNPLHMLQRHGRRVSKKPVVDRSVSGRCSDSQDAVGSLYSASASGITSLAQCAQHATDISHEANYVSFSSIDSECMWFVDCACLASSSTCLGGDTWTSIAISDTIKQVGLETVEKEKPLLPQPRVSVSAESTASSISTVDTGSDITCDTSSSDLMQHFQSACNMSQNIWYTRLVAGIVVLGILAVVGVAQGVAYKLDQDELK
jgi:hypothetical protein